MRFSKLALSTVLCASLLCLGTTNRAEAGPLLDWLFGKRSPAPAYAVGGPVPIGNGQAYGYAPYGAGAPGYAAQGYAANYGTYANNYGNYYNSRMPVLGNGGAGYIPPAPQAALAPTLPPAAPLNTLSYVPAYRTNSYRAPVTYYRPLLATDPVTGAQVVTQAPCTSYEYQTQRVPILGSQRLYGSTLAPRFQPAPQALPTYTIPSGGVPLAAAAPRAASQPQGTVRGYPGYNSTIPSQSVAPGTYPTAPVNRSRYGSSPSDYYGSPAPSGGSTGGYPNAYTAPNYPTPGLAAPQAPPPSTPGRIITPAPSYGQPVPNPNAASPSSGLPGTQVPGRSPNSGADPADFPPVLPPTGDRAGVSPSGMQLRGMQQVARQPSYSNSANSSGGSAETSSPSQTGARENPFMAPIPTPSDFEAPKQRWNPGLLRENDMTAMRPIVQPGASKQIHWASFEESTPSEPTARELSAPSNGLRPIADRPATQESRRDPQVQHQLQREWQQQRDWQEQSLRQPTPAPAELRVPKPQPYQPPRRYDASGWQPSK